jgi:hypothetical protein
MAVNASTGPASAKAKAAEKKLKWGVKLRLDVNKPVVGLAAHPSASQLMVLFDDGSLRSYALTPSGLQMIWPAAFMLPGGQTTACTSACPFFRGWVLFVCGCVLARLASTLQHRTRAFFGAAFRVACADNRM